MLTCSGGALQASACAAGAWRVTWARRVCSDAERARVMTSLAGDGRDHLQNAASLCRPQEEIPLGHD